MEACSNCSKSIQYDHCYCSFCGYPNTEYEIKYCQNGHEIFATFNECPICLKLESKIFSKNQSELNTYQSIFKTEKIDADTHIKSSIINESIENKTLGNTAASDITILKDTVGTTNNKNDIDDKTTFETETDFAEKTIFEDEEDKTILDSTGPESQPLFFAWLVIVDEKENPLHDFRLKQHKNVIGKEINTDIHIKDEFASKFHAVIHYEEGNFYLSDLGSSNHTWLNQKKIIKASLNDGDKIKIGHQNIIFKMVRRIL